MSIRDFNRHSVMTCDNDCTLAGWTEALVTDGATEIHISFHPDADLEGEFWAFCHDEQEMIRVSGWHIVDTEILST